MVPKQAKLQIFISIFINNLQEQPDFVCGRFIKVFYKTTTFEWSQECWSYTGLTVLLVLLTLVAMIK